MKLALLFPGQGSQYIGMGSGLSDKSKFHYADHVLDEAFSQQVFSGEENWLTKTKHSQMAIFLLSASLYDAFKKTCALPVFAVAGLSLGEYSALYAAGSISFEDAFALVRLRAMHMDEACREKEGTMSAVLGLTKEEIEEVIAPLDDAWLANHNMPLQSVVSGSKKSLSQLTPLLLEKGAKKVVPLEVQGAFHSPFMEPAQKAFSPQVKKASISPPNAAFYMNVLGSSVAEVDQMKSLLTQQITKPVLWCKTMEDIIEEVDVCIELGPGKTLSKIARKMGAKQVFSVEKEEDFLSIKNTLGNLDG